MALTLILNMAWTLPAHAAQPPSDFIPNAVTAQQWSQLSARLDQISGVSSTPINVQTNGFTPGALLGNGDLGIVSGGTTGRQDLYFGRSDAWGQIWAVTNGEYRDSILRVATMQISGSTSKASKATYQMKQDIRRARVDATLDSGLQTTTWTTDDQNCAVTNLTNTSTSTMTATIQLTSPPWPDSQRTVSANASAGIDGGILWGARSGDPTSVGYATRQAFATAVVGGHFDHTAASGTTATGTLILPAGTTATVVTAFDSASGKLTPTSPTLTALRRAAARSASQQSQASISELYDQHEGWWRNYWLDSSITVNDPTMERYYYGAQYVLGSTIRSGKLAPGLWGSWITTDEPSWQGKYFLNYDWQAAVYGSASSNRLDQLQPFYRAAIDNTAFSQPATAAAGYQGSLTPRTIWPYVTTMTPPDPAPVAAAKNYSVLPSDQKSNAVFALEPAIWYYQYSGDTNYLRQQLYPALRAVDDFYRDYVTWDGANKRWVFQHSGSHEGSDDTNSSLDIGFARQLWHLLISSSATLGIDGNMVPVWQSYLDHLADFPVGNYQGTSVLLNAEKMGAGSSFPAFDPGNQPVNLEGPVFPGDQINLNSPAAERDLVLNTLTTMNSWPDQGNKASVNGFPKIYTIAARVGWPAQDLKDKIDSGIMYNFRGSNLTRAQGGGGIETSGTTESINSMLLQSENDTVRLFPCWPTSDPASFNRLRAQGGFVVSSSLRDGVVGSTTVTSDHGGTLELVSPWRTTPSVQEIDQTGRVLAPVTVHAAAGKVSFATSAGKTYLIRGVGTAPQPPNLTGQTLHLVPGRQASAQLSATLTNPNEETIGLGKSSLSLPAGWGASVQREPGLVNAASSVTFGWRLTLPKDLRPGDYPAKVTVPASAGPLDWRLQAAITISVHGDARSLSAQLNNIGITSEANTKPGNIDGNGNSYSAEALAEAGATFGPEQDLDGLRYAWPNAAIGAQDNIAGSAVVSVGPVRTTQIGLLGAESSQHVGTGVVTLIYRDGTESTGVASFPNWANATQSDIDSSGAQVAFDSNRRNTPTQGGANRGIRYRMYSVSIPADQTKVLTAIVLPDDANCHVFALGLPTNAVTPAAASVSVHPAVVESGRKVRIEAQNLDAGVPYSVELASASAAEPAAIASADGTATWQLAVPVTLPAGRHSVDLVDAAGHRLASSWLTVRAGDTANSGSTHGSTSGGGSLARTGSGVGPMAVCALALIVIGVVLGRRRLTRR